MWQTGKNMESLLPATEILPTDRIFASIRHSEALEINAIIFLTLESLFLKINSNQLLAENVIRDSDSRKLKFQSRSQ